MNEKKPESLTEIIGNRKREDIAVAASAALHDVEEAYRKMNELAQLLGLLYEDCDEYTEEHPVTTSLAELALARGHLREYLGTMDGTIA